MRSIAIPLILTCSAALALAGHGSGTSLQITVNSPQTFASPGLTTLIQSDGSPYINGSDGVCATMSANATTLTLELDCSSSSKPRQLTFPYGPFPGAPIAPPTGQSSYGCAPSPNPPAPTSPYTNKILVGVTTAFQSMQVGTVYGAQIVFATQSTTMTGTSAYRLDYDTGADFPTDGAKASPALVYRVSATEWVIESAPSSGLPGSPGNAAMLVQEITSKHTVQTTECGFYQVPFSFTLDVVQ